MVARVCLSDLHLGDPRSVLNDPNVAENVAKEIGRITGGKIGQLVLNGDVWEECTPANMDDRVDEACGGFACSVVTASRVFFRALQENAEIDEFVWVPGNHDLSLLQTTFGYPCRTQPRGARVDSIALNALMDVRRADTRIAYPVFMPTDSPWILFTHGHLMDPLVRGIAPDIEYAALAALGCPRPITQPEGEASLQDLAKRTDPFTLALWKRYSQLDAKYQEYILRRFDHLPDDPESVRAAIVGAPVRAQMRIDTAPGSLWPHVDWLLTAALLDSRIQTPTSKDEPMTFVFGHDHLGTRAWRGVCDQQVLVVDSGGWTSDYPWHRPHSRVLVWPEKSDVEPVVYYVSTPGLP